MTAITRRRLLALGGLAIVAAAGAGATTAATLRRTVRSIAPTPVPSPSSSAPPAQLVAVLAHEQGLIAALTAAISADPQPNPLLPNLRDDHVAHVQAIRAALGPNDAITAGTDVTSALTPTGPAASARPTGSTSAAPPDRATLRAAEGQAQSLAASASAALSGADAVLLASISACEAGHVELLT